MKKNKDKIFRFPFDIDRRVFLILTIVFFIFALKPVQHFLKGTYNIQKVQHKIESHLNKNMELARKQLTAPALRDLSLHGFQSEYARSGFNFPFYVYVYLQDSLIYWNNNNVLPKIENKASVLPVQLHEGSYVQVKMPHQADKQIQVFLLLPVKEDFHNAKNRVYFYALGQENDFGFDIQTSYAEGAVPLRFENETPYYLFRKKSPINLNDPYGWQLFIAAFPFIFMGISIHTYYKVVVKDRIRHKIFFLVLFSAIGIRFLHLYTGFPNDFSEFSAFDPSIYYHDVLNRSLGDTFVNLCLVFWVLLFYIMNVQGTDSDHRFFRKAKWVFAIKTVFLAGLAVFLIHLIETIIIKTEITFDSTLFSSIDFLSFVGILTFMVGMANILLISLIFNNRCNALGIHPWFKYGVLLFLYGLTYFTLQSYFHTNSIHYLYLLIFVLIILMDNKKMRIRFDFNSYELILWIIIFSLIITQYLILTIEQKEKNNRVVLAEKIAAQFQLSHLTEPLFGLQEAIRDEYELGKWNSSDSVSFLSELYYKYFRNISDQYEISVRSINTSDSTVSASSVPTLQVIKNNQRDSLFYTQNNQEVNIYFDVFPYKQKKLGIRIRLYKNRNRFAITEKDYTQNGIRNKNIEYNYQVGVYQDSNLIASSGSQGIHSTIRPAELFKDQNVLFKDAGSNSELWYQDRLNRITVLISKNYSVFSRFLTLFACLFFIYFSVVSLYILGNIIARSNLVKKRFYNLLNVNLRLRIHSTIIMVILISFLSVGYFTSYYLISHYKTNTSAKAIEKMAQVKSNLLSYLHTLSDSGTTLQRMIHACENLSQDNNLPINIYHYGNGQLIHSTSRLLNEINFPTPIISPKAFHELRTNKLEYVSFHETKNENDYYSTFSSFFSPDGQTKLILQLPYQNSRIYFQQETFSVIVTLINTFVVVFLISAFIALLITNSVVQPFTYIVRQFTKINLSKTNEPLTWQYNDEIGLLIREYNRMLRKLENSSQLLARSEREMAWREMAKQVAHEIKNPLTPMKLSLQMLDKAIREDKPNIREMTERVTKTIIEQIETLTVIATNFSTFARMPENKNEVIRLNEVLSAVTGMYNSDAKNEFDFIIPYYDIYIYADKTQLIRVFTNIVQNAIQAIPETSKGLISMRVKKIKDNFVRISISDNGTGISKEKQSKLFQPYFTTKSSGTGLGLAMSKDIIEQLNGRITLESVIDEGTTFFIDLPIHDVELPSTDDRKA